MTNIVNTGNASVDALAEMNISGNVTPVNWYKTILRENGKPYLLAICVLLEIVYWYRPVEVRDEHSGMTIGYRKKFREDLLQNNTTKVRNIRSYMLTTLYNAPVTCSNYYKAEVNHDFYGK